MKTKIFIILACVVGIATSCVKSEKSSSEADILGFDIEEITLISKPQITSNEVIIMISEKNWDAVVVADMVITPIVKVSEGATLSPPAGTQVKLSEAKFKVTSQNGQVEKEYTLQPTKEYAGDSVHFSFEDWKVDEAGGYTKSGDANWSSGNVGISTALSMLGRDKIPANYPSQMTTDGKSGNAVKLVTTPGGATTFFNVPVWAGNFFLGNFNFAKALSSTLEATEFGRFYKRKPFRLHGYYKYKEGTGQYNNNGTEVTQEDKCSIYAVFYRAGEIGTDGKIANEITLTAYNINSSPAIIARADLADGSATAGDDFHEFNLDFGTYPEEPDFDHYKYKLAIVFSSSAAGGTPALDGAGNPTKTAIYAGKVGSTLIVDEVSVVNY